MRRRRLFSAVAIAFAVVLTTGALEVGSRAFWRIQYELSFRRPNHVLYAFYPELKSVDEARPTRQDGNFNILLLGGSVFHPAWGEIEPALYEQLDAAGVRHVRIFNLGVPAHTSRDSMLKYTALSRPRFNLVVFYHGANDTRTNNIPTELFRNDYSHYGWYALVNTVAPYHDGRPFALPYTWRYAVASVKQSFNRDQYAPTHEPRAQWMQYGHNLLSVSAFEQNVRQVMAIAAERHDPLMLMTFAYYVPDNYSREAFEQKRLDYGLHRMPIEVWGRREDVVAALSAQNDVLRRLAAGRPDVSFVDEAQLMRRSRETFDDPFHLTIRGSMEFAAHMVDAIRPRL